MVGLCVQILLNYFTFLNNKFFQRKKSANSIDVRPKRLCSKPNRLGQRESTVNHNDFFESLRKQTSQSSNDQVHDDVDKESELVKTTTCHTQNKQTVPENEILIDDSVFSVSALDIPTQEKCCRHDTEFKTLTIAYMKSIKEHLIRLEAKVSHQQNRNESLNEATGIVDVTKLKIFGVPVDSEQKLLALDKNLKDDQYRVKLVIKRLLEILRCFLLLFVNVFVFISVQCPQTYWW